MDSIFLLVFSRYYTSERSEQVKNRVKHEKKIPYLQATMNYFVYYTNTVC